MPPLSAYTPFESLLFFQSLAALETRPASFSTISDVLQNNPFIRENVAFDTNRLSPEALEELYTTLIQEWLEEKSHNADQNGHRPDRANANANPKKRKITNPTAENVKIGDPRTHATIVPGLVSQLYAQYKELVTKEIRDDEKRYGEIREEIEQLQKQEAEQHAEPIIQNVAVPNVAEQMRPQVIVPALDTMDIDPKKEKEQEPAPVAAASKPTQERSKELQQPVPVQAKQAGKIDVPRPPVPSAIPPPPVPPPQQQHQQPPAATPSETAAAVQAKPTSPARQPTPTLLVVSDKPLPRPVPINGNPPMLAPSQPVGDNASSMPAKSPMDVPPSPQPPRPQVHPPMRTSRQPSRERPTLPPGSTIVFPAQQGVSLPSASPGTPRPTQVGEIVARKGPPVATVPPMIPQFPPGQQPFQQWSPHPTPQTPSGNISPFTNTPCSNQPILERPVPSQQAAPITQHDNGRPFPHPYPAVGPFTPGPLLSSTQSPMTEAPGQRTPLYIRTSSFSTTLSKRPSRQSVDTAGSLTPWKRSPRLSLSIPQSPGSPVRPRPEDVSPISDRAPSPIEPLGAPAKKVSSRRKRNEIDNEKTRRNRKRSVQPLDLENTGAEVGKSMASSQAKHAESAALSRSRGRSIASRDDESATDSGSATTRNIKHEAPTTPAGILEDTEADIRVGTRRRGPPTTGMPEEGAAKGRRKRKRGASESVEIDTGQLTPIRYESSQFVLGTRNFPRTGAPIMNDVAAHKHASIFAKPLTEREAPGYKDLIYRPQDLKSIKSAIHQGSRAVSAATEAANTPADGESPIPAAGTPSKNAVLVLQKTADLIPPKGIVNSSQLEKELIRMFANAVMFNPAPDRERGFGPTFPMTKGKVSRASTQPWQADEGGIIRDTREMCDDVEQAVTGWRAAERTTDELGNKSFFSLRRNSVSDMNTEGADDTKGS